MARILNLTSPFTKGAAVASLQRAIRHVLVDIRHEPCALADDGVYGPATRDAEAHAAWALGVATPRDHKRAQAVIRNPALRTPAELLRARAYVKAAAARETSGPAGAVALALKLARQVPHITENPPGTNWGGLITTMQQEVGLDHDYWCGAAAHYFLKHGGGINVDRGIVYCPTTEALAKAGTGGFKAWIPAERATEAPVGSLVLFDEGGIAGHVEILCSRSDGRTVHDVGGNTSAGDGESQSNGGGVFERTRPITGGFPVRGFAVPRWP